MLLAVALASGLQAIGAPKAEVYQLNSRLSERAKIIAAAASSTPPYGGVRCIFAHAYKVNTSELSDVAPMLEHSVGASFDPVLRELVSAARQAPDAEVMLSTSDRRILESLGFRILDARFRKRASKGRCDHIIGVADPVVRGRHALVTVHYGPPDPTIVHSHPMLMERYPHGWQTRYVGEGRTLIFRYR